MTPAWRTQGRCRSMSPRIKMALSTNQLQDKRKTRVSDASGRHRAHREEIMIDEAKLHQFVGQMLNDLGGAVSLALVQMGDALGLYKTLHEKGPMTTQELAAAA